VTRRDLFPTLALAGGLAAAAPPAQRFKQSVTSGVFGKGAVFEDTVREAADLGFQGYDLIGPSMFPLLKKYGLTPSMVPGYGGTIGSALNRKENHARLEQSLREGIAVCAAAGAPNLITFSGNRGGMSDAEGLDNCVLLLDRVKAMAEDQGVTICVELLNSKVDHHDYMCDHSAWGVELCKRVNSSRVKLLFDIYHMQIMEGDIARTLRANIAWIAHFHTGGNPGRHEIDSTQELNYRFVAETIASLNFTGFVAHEYSPAPGRDPLTSLKAAKEIFTV
jgi:hydroxypyruvate isomerase